MYRTAAVVTLAGAMLAACTNSTQYVSSWKDPTAPAFHLQHTLAVFMTTDAGMRRMVEDRLAARLPGGVPSYRIVPDEQLSEIDSVRAHVVSGNFDGAVVMRLVGTETQVNVTSYPGFYGYWGYWGSAYNPVEYSTSKLYYVETVLYSLSNAKLVWMGRSETVDPKNANKLADYSATFAVNNMRRDGFLK
jgi:hypothetical protein